MKKKLNIILIIILSCFVSEIALSQPKDTMAIIQIYHQNLIAVDSLLFDVHLIRKSDKWDRYVNSTFEIESKDSAFIIAPDKIKIELVQNSSTLTLATIVGNQLPVNDYLVTPNVLNGRISITIAGPESYDYCVPTIRDSVLKIGTFLITRKDPANPAILSENLFWLQPYYYYQACAYKTPVDIYFDSSTIVKYQPQDNVEMFDGNLGIVDYTTENKPEPVMKVINFIAEYAGLKKVECRWTTVTEAKNKGFILKRALMGLDIRDTLNDINLVEFARWNGTKPEEKNLIGMGTHDPGRAYKYDYDTVQYRGADYCYFLYYQDFNDNIHYLAYACLPIPNSVITFAQPNPNPFSSSTTIKFTVDDDVYLTATVYDVGGKEVTKLFNNEYVKYGTYEKEYVPSSLASQGLYEIIFIAYPVDDPAIEIFRAVVKLQLIR